MILVDLNQVMISALMKQVGNNAKIPIDENLIRHMVLNILRSYNKKFKQNYGELVICCDNTTFWRKEFFPFYKANRKKARDASGFDWNLIFHSLNKIRDELKEFSPYKILDVKGAEADDIIGVLVNLETGKDNLILSSDKDFVQLQRALGIDQFSPS